VLVNEICALGGRIGNHISVLNERTCQNLSAALLKDTRYLFQKVEELINREKLESVMNDFVNKYKTVFDKDELCIFKHLCLQRCMFHYSSYVRWITWVKEDDRAITLKDVSLCPEVPPMVKIATSGFNSNLTSVTDAWSDKTYIHNWANHEMVGEMPTKHVKFGFLWRYNGQPLRSDDVAVIRAFFEVPTIISSKMFFFGVYHLYTHFLIIRNAQNLMNVESFDSFDVGLHTFNSTIEFFPFNIRHDILVFLPCYLCSD
jgi:hypothetical protein